MTKAELEAKVAELERDCENLAQRVVTAKRDARDAEEAAIRAESKLRGLMLWEANNSTGSPLCLVGDDGNGLGLSLNIFTHGDQIVGVSAFEVGAAKCVGEIGLVPAVPAEERV